MERITLNKNVHRGISAVVCIVYGYFFLQSLNLITKMSFLRTFSPLETLNLVFLAPLFPSLVIIVAYLICSPIISFIQPKTRANYINFEGALLATAIFLTLERSLYIVTEIGILNSHGAVAIAFVVCYLIFLAFQAPLGRLINRGLSYKMIKPVPLCLLLTSLVLSISSIQFTGTFSPHPLTTAEPKTRPNILMIGSDGVSARNASAYGYERATTPYLEKFAEDAVVAENAFSNSCTTSSSLTSKLTGILPFGLGLIAYPDILKDQSSFLHLPRILKDLGYSTYDISIRNLSDPYDINLRWGFDWANGRALGTIDPPEVFPRLTYSLNSARYLAFSISEDAIDRLLHLFRLRNIPHLPTIVRRISDVDRDESRIEQAKNIIRTSKSPYFLHVHLMGTHGFYFFPRERLFSAGKSQIAYFDQDFYDDAILEFDKSVAEIISLLKETKQFDNTIIIINSDHGKEWSCERTPLLMHFPGTAPRTIKENVQHLDLAPTVLRFLGVSPPPWMTGRDLLSAKLNPLEPIYFVSKADEHEFHQPNLNLRTVGAYVCNHRFEQELPSGKVQDQLLPDHTAPCDQGRIPSVETVSQLFTTLLQSTQYGR